MILVQRRRSITRLFGKKKKKVKSQKKNKKKFTYSNSHTKKLITCTQFNFVFVFQFVDLLWNVWSFDRQRNKKLLALECVDAAPDAASTRTCFCCWTRPTTFASIYTPAVAKLRPRHASSSSWCVFLRWMGPYFSSTPSVTLYVTLKYVF